MKKKRIILKYNWIKLFTAKNTSITCPYNVRISLCHFKSNAICKRSFWPPHPCSLISPCTALFALNLKAGVPAVSSLTLPYSKGEIRGVGGQRKLRIGSKGKATPSLPYPAFLLDWASSLLLHLIAVLCSVSLFACPPSRGCQLRLSSMRKRRIEQLFMHGKRGTRRVAKRRIKNKDDWSRLRKSGDRLCEFRNRGMKKSA